MTGLYVHIPFCLRKCKYCDFYSVGRAGWKKDDYEAAVLRNLARYDETYDTIYFGGGTPCLAINMIEKILRAAEKSPDAEITVECNPEASDYTRLVHLIECGVNRLSFGVQSMNDDELIALGRVHNALTAKEMINNAAKLGFKNISADIMLGTPKQTKESLSRTIEELCELPIKHVSAYMLKIEPNTPFGRNPPVLPDEEATAEMYLTAVEMLEKRGFRQYEISNFAREGFECRHNLKYWKREEYIGIGAAAHSFYGGKRYGVPRDLNRFINSEEQPVEVTDGAPDAFEEKVMLGLRLREGIDKSLWGRFEKTLKTIPAEYYRLEEERLSLTPRGFLVSNEIIAKLLNN